MIIILLAVLAAAAAASYVKKLSSGCCGAGGDKEKKILPQDTDISSYPYLCRVGIEGMTCKNCAMRIENVFNKREGFYASVDFKNNTAEIRTKNPPTDFEIRSTIVGLGYSVVSIDKSCEKQP